MCIRDRASIGQILRIPISHGEGNYVADEITLGKIEQNGQILLRYCTEDGDVNEKANPNGSYKNIAGVTNESGNVLGMMPHPERCCESVLGGTDGRVIFESVIASLKTGQYTRDPI